jgi:hypothetical protein
MKKQTNEENIIQKLTQGQEKKTWRHITHSKRLLVVLLELSKSLDKESEEIHTSAFNLIFGFNCYTRWTIKKDW